MRTDYMSIVLLLKFLKFAIQPSQSHRTPKKNKLWNEKQCFRRLRRKSAVAKKKNLSIQSVWPNSGSRFWVFWLELWCLIGGAPHLIWPSPNLMIRHECADLWRFSEIEHCPTSFRNFGCGLSSWNWQPNNKKKTRKQMTRNTLSHHHINLVIMFFPAPVVRAQRQSVPRYTLRGAVQWQTSVIVGPRPDPRNSEKKMSLRWNWPWRLSSFVTARSPLNTWTWTPGLSASAVHKCKRFRGMASKTSTVCSWICGLGTSTVCS